MKLSINREELLKPLQLVSGVVERKQTLPILSHLLIHFEDGKVNMVGTDLEVEMAVVCNAKGSGKGKTTIPARKFLDICRALPENSKIDLELKKEKIYLKSASSRFVLSTLSAEEFPGIEIKGDLSSFDIPQNQLKKAIDKTGFSMAHQDVRYYLNGMLFELNSAELKLISTDGHRLAVYELTVNSGIDESQQLIIPRKGILELSRLLQDEDKPARISLGRNYIQVSTDEVSFVSKLIDGKFPDYRNVLPKNPDKIILCKKQLFANALNRVAILSNEKYRGVRVEFSQDNIKIVAHNPDKEEAEEEVEIKYAGVEFEIGFNVSYLYDAVSACSSDDIRLSLTDSNSCCLIEDIQDNCCKYVVMPMRL